MIKRIKYKKRMMGWSKIEFLRVDLILLCIHPIFLHEEICDPMEKIWVKKEF